MIRTETVFGKIAAALLTLGGAKMSNKRNKKGLWANKHLRYIVGIMILCTLVYYLPVIAGAIGWTGFSDSMNSLHNLYGIDFLGLIFFAPVVYAAYVLGVVPSILVALISMLALLPHAILIDNYPNALFKPTAFVIIMSAVGAVVAMLQKSEQQHRQRMREMKCLYDIGRASGDSHSVEEFLGKVVTLIPQAITGSEESRVRLTFHDQVFKSPNFQKAHGKVAENLMVNNETIGMIEIYSTRDNPVFKKKNHLTKTLAERISSAIHQIELEQSLNGYYEQLETEVESRTKDLEQVQEKLIRSERLAAVGELASGVGHELRNPLNVIRNCAYLLNMALSEKADEESLNTLKVLDKQIDAANKIVTDLLDFTRIRPPQQIRADLKTMLRECVSYQAVPENIKVNINLNGHVQPVRTDPEQMNRVFSNIISNAIQSMNSKGGELDIDAAIDNDYVSVLFKDTGCGIPPENLEKIYEPLFTTKPKGIGLGLAISRRLVEQNGGKIEVASKVGQGTTFTVKLPLEKRRETPNE
jgi:signal transduction histidine kinase